MPKPEPEFIFEWANKVKYLGLSTPIAIFLEAYKPLSFVTGQFMVIGQPFLNLFLSASFTGNAIRLFSKRTELDVFIKLLERD